MNKFKKFIITKILRVPLPSTIQKPLIVRESLDIEKVGVNATSWFNTPIERTYETIGLRIGKYLIENGLVEIAVERSDIDCLNHFRARVDVVRRSKND